jgi:uncharacterized damage-inducible protein DinB
VKDQTLLRGVTEILRQGEMLLCALDDGAYATRLPRAFNASVGGHYRHCLDHFQSLLDALDGDVLDYDVRRRDPRVERERAYALSETRRIIKTCTHIPLDWLTRPVRVRCKVSYGDEAAPVAMSTLGRELMYAVAHAIHHYALIGVMCGMLDTPLPSGFGVAPSTLKHQEKQQLKAA